MTTTRINVVKIGGNVIDDPAALAAFLDDFAAMEGPKILVHGGGKEATRLSQSMGLQTQMIGGRRVTDAATLEVVTMVYAGLINKRIVAMLQARGVDAIGLCGADARLITSRKRPALPTDYGFVGDVEAVSSSAIERLLTAGFTPAVCAITRGADPEADGLLLNTNADSVARAVAVGAARVAPTRLTFCFEQPGVMASVSDPSSLIAEITPEKFAALRADGTVSGGMLPKIENALGACADGVEAVVIKSSAKLADPTAGTTIRLQ